MDKLLKKHTENLGAVSKELAVLLPKTAKLITEVFLSGGRLFILGCGISNILAKYAHNLFIDNPDRPPFPCFYIASGEVYHSEAIDLYEQALSAVIKASDALLTFCADPKGRDAAALIHTLRKQKAAGTHTICFTSSHSEQFTGLCDKLLAVPADTERDLNLAHIFALHALLRMVEAELFP